MNMSLSYSGSSLLSQEMQECIQNCTDCHQICLAMVPHCLSLGGQHAAPEHIKLLLTCADICQTSAHFMLLNSPLHMRTCALCADVCEQCALDCDRIGDDEHMRQCAETCRRCAASCRQMASMGMH